MTMTVNLVLSDLAHQKFTALKNKLEKNQHETANIIFENMDINSFEKGKS